MKTSQRARRAGNPLGVHRNDDALRAEAPGGLFDQLRILDGRRIDADFVGAGVEQAAHVADFAHAAADGKRNETCDATCSIIPSSSPRLSRARGDVQESEFVGALLVVAAGDFDRIAGIAQARRN